MLIIEHIIFYMHVVVIIQASIFTTAYSDSSLIVSIILEGF